MNFVKVLALLFVSTIQADEVKIKKPLKYVDPSQPCKTKWNPETAPKNVVH
jgi:hypothetical protein